MFSKETTSTMDGKDKERERENGGEVGERERGGRREGGGREGRGEEGGGEGGNKAI